MATEVENQAATDTAPESDEQENGQEAVDFASLDVQVSRLGIEDINSLAGKVVYLYDTKTVTPSTPRGRERYILVLVNDPKQDRKQASNQTQVEITKRQWQIASAAIAKAAKQGAPTVRTRIEQTNRGVRFA